MERKIKLSASTVISTVDNITLVTLVGFPAQVDSISKIFQSIAQYNINIDMISFNVRISPASFLISVLLTFVFSAAVDFFMYFKLQKINMAQSLKSIE